MTSGGWHSQEQRHGRHRPGATGAWTPAVRPTEASPVHAVRDRTVPFTRPSDSGPSWPAPEEFARPADWPAEPFVPLARHSPDAPVWPTDDDEKPTRRTVSADMVLDTVPLSAVAAGNAEAVVYALPEAVATGLRKFDLGNVPASVTPPRSWRRAAWFAVGTSAAVVLGLTVAASELMGRPVSDNTLVDALPAYPTGPLTLEKLPNQQSTTPHTPSPASTPGRPKPSHPSASAPTNQGQPPKDTVTGTGGTTVDSPGPSGPPSTEAVPPASTMALTPTRQTVGTAVVPTDTQAMGDRTEEYFRLVTTDPAAAYALTTGGMAREGQEGIEARYAGVRRIEVQSITIDRGQAVTTSTVRIISQDGTAKIEQRQLTFTWGGDPKITDDAITQ